jgi:large subunit ribosomal protein L25
MEKVVLKASKREVIGKQVRALRREGKLPAVLYGRHIENPISLVMELRDTSRALAKVSSSSLVTLDVDGTEYPALVREKQRDFIKNRLLHVDFLIVSLTEKLTAHVGVELIGLSLAIKDFNAVLVTGLDQIEVECLPGDLPEKIVVDISALAKVGDVIHVRDVVLSDKVKILSNPDEMLAIATAAKVEEVVEAAVATTAVGEEPEVIEKGKKEEEGEEGEKTGKTEKPERAEKPEKKK